MGWVPFRATQASLHKILLKFYIIVFNNKTSVLVIEALDYGISRMIQNLTEGTVPFKIEVFKSSKQALAWLEEKPPQ